MSVTGFIRRCLANGMDLETALLAAEQMEDEAALLAAMTPRQARNQRYYENRKRLKASEKRLNSDAQIGLPQASESVLKRLKASEIKTSLARGEDNPSRLVISGDVVDVVVERERENDFDDWPKRDPAKVLVELVASPWLDPAKSPGLITTAPRLAAWKRDGASWTHDVVPVVTGLCANRRAAISTWKFFDQAIAQSIADNRQALNIPEARAPPAKGSTFADRLAEEQAEVRRRVLAMGNN